MAAMFCAHVAGDRRQHHAAAQGEHKPEDFRGGRENCQPAPGAIAEAGRLRPCQAIAPQSTAKSRKPALHQAVCRFMVRRGSMSSG